MPAEIIKKRFAVDDYRRMAEAGILRPKDRVELIDGEVIQMSPIGHRHRVRLLRATTLFGRAFGDRALVACQSDLKLNDWTEPQPDILVLKPRADFYAGKDWTPEDVFFLTEVSDSSLRYDLSSKVPLFAASGIPEVWIEDVNNDILHVYRDPRGGAYAISLELQRQDRISPIAFPDIRFSVDDLFGDPVKE
jgi:Uma2 family endonuclease